ncbi:MAG: GntR family transcriptional regulator [Firmicutes bacterium]|jgi:DNA-binding GntR family transcriptional regulator|nr:GntR family transcriptional regulator [Bacillota bacterium]
MPMMNLDFLSNDYQEKKTKAQKIEEEIKIEILSGRLRTGQRIVEQDLCDKYGISRTPIREILRRIESEGLIETIPNRGAFVKGFTEQNIDDFYVMKSALEIQCIRWAIERITDDELDMLQQTFEFMEFYTMSDDLEKMLRINNGFDTIIYRACHNREMEKTLHRYNFYLKYAASNSRYPANYLTTVLEEHRAIFHAFMTRNPEAGAEAAEIHMLKTMIRRK